MRQRIGLLACDSIWEPLRSAFGDYADMYGALLGATGADFELETYAVFRGELPARVDACAAWLISGSRRSVHDAEPWIATLQAFTRTAYAAGTPQVGICFGHQLLAQALGGRTERMPAGWSLGNVPVNLCAGPHEALGLPASLRLFMAHQDHVAQLPPQAEWLAAAAHCPHAAFTLGNRVLGLQAHPEFTPAFMRALTEDTSLAIPSALRMAALASYAEPDDSAALGQSIAKFLRLLD